MKKTLIVTMFGVLLSACEPIPPASPPPGPPGPSGPSGSPGPAGQVERQIIIALPAEAPRNQRTTMQVAAIGHRPFENLGTDDVSFRGFVPEPVVTGVSVRSPNNLLVYLWVSPNSSGSYNLLAGDLVLRDALTVIPTGN